MICLLLAECWTAGWDVAHILPPRSLICRVTTDSPIHMIEKTPANTRSVCFSGARMLRNMLSSRQKISGPHRSQSLNPSLIPPCRIPSASTIAGHLPTSPLRSRPKPWLSTSPPSALFKTPPRRYLGQSTCFIFSHTAKRSLDTVSHTDSSIVFWGALLSSPGIAELRYPRF